MFFISAERLEKKWKKWLKKMYEVRVIYYCDSVKVGTAMTAEYAVDIAFDFANRLEENGYKWLEVYGLYFYIAAEYRRRIFSSSPGCNRVQRAP